MTLNCYKLKFSRNFARFRRFGSQQQLNEWRYPYCQRRLTELHVFQFTSLTHCSVGLHRCGISPSRFLAECRKRWLKRGSFVMLYFVLYAFCIVFFCILLYSFLCQYQSSAWLWRPNDLQYVGTRRNNKSNSFVLYHWPLLDHDNTHAKSNSIRQSKSNFIKLLHFN